MRDNPAVRLSVPWPWAPVRHDAPNVPGRCSGEGRTALVAAEERVDRGAAGYSDGRRRLCMLFWWTRHQTCGRPFQVLACGAGVREMPARMYACPDPAAGHVELEWIDAGVDS